MKHLHLIIVWTLCVTLGMARLATGEPAPDLANPLVLDSPCDALDNKAKLLSKHFAALEGQLLAGLLTKYDNDAYRSSLKTFAIDLQNALIQCWSTEDAYYVSERDNRGTAGQTETANYKAAIDAARSKVDALDYIESPLSAYDYRINLRIKSFYLGWLDKFSQEKNLTNVKKLHDRLRESVNDLYQVSIVCRKNYYEGSSTNCDSFDQLLAFYQGEIASRVDTTTPLVKKATSDISSSQAAFDATKASLEAHMKEIERIKGQIPVYMAAAQSTQAALGYHMGVFNWALGAYYWAQGIANYYGYLTRFWWGYIYSYWWWQNLANGYLWWVYYEYYTVIPTLNWYLQSYMSAISSLTTALNSYQAAVTKLEQSANDQNSAVEFNKGLLRALSVKLITK